MEIQDEFIKENLILNRLRYFGIHIFALYVFFVPFLWKLAALGLMSYIIGMWGLEVCQHRYLSHKSFKTSRIFQFILVIIGGLTGQRGALWWASRHRQHHMHTETSEDPQSPIINPWNNSLFWAQFGWSISRTNSGINLKLVPDLYVYPEIVILSRYFSLLPILAGLMMFYLGYSGVLGSEISGLQALLWGFVLPAVAILQVGNAVNTLGHGGIGGGYRTYDTNDCSRNRPILAILTLGAGYHNNHHRFPASAKSGFLNKEIDLAYISLLGLQKLGLIWDLTPLPDNVLKEGQISAHLKGNLY